MIEVWKKIQQRRTEVQARSHYEAEQRWAQATDPGLFAIPLAVARELAAMGVA